jgi:hypothetical protein
MKKLLAALLFLIGPPALAVDTTFVPNQTVISAQFMNDVNAVIYRSNSGIAGVTQPMYRAALAKLADTINVKDFGALCDGLTDDTTAINAAIAAMTVGGTLRYSGACLISSTITVNKKIRLVGEGGIGTTISNLPTSYFLKASSLNGSALSLTASGLIMEGGGVVGQVGNGGDNIVFLGNSITARDVTSALAGQDGFRIGSDVPGTNANSWSLINDRSFNNVRHGFYIHDKPGAPPDANAGNAVGNFAHDNGGDGFWNRNAALNKYSGNLGEANTGQGFHMGETSRASGNKSAFNSWIVGGDYEANVAGQVLFDVGSLSNGIVGASEDIIVVDNGFLTRRADSPRQTRVAYTPGLVGSTGADQAITSVSVSSTTATATIAGHGYSNGDSIWHRGFANGNLNGVFVISNVTANTYDFTIRNDANFLAPTSGTGTARKAGVYTTANGQYSLDGDKCFFEAYVLTSALTNITGVVQLILPVIPISINSGSLWADAHISRYSGITHTGTLAITVAQSGVVNQNLYSLVSNTGPVQLNVSGLAAASEVMVSGWYFVNF